MVNVDFAIYKVMQTIIAQHLNDKNNYQMLDNTVVDFIVPTRDVLVTLKPELIYKSLKSKTP